MFHRFLTWPTIFIVVVCFWNVGWPQIHMINYHGE